MAPTMLALRWIAYIDNICSFADVLLITLSSIRSWIYHLESTSLVEWSHVLDRINHQLIVSRESYVTQT